MSNPKYDPYRTYKTWQHMLSRCQDPRHPSYQRYGAKGITVCEDWQDYITFLTDMGERPRGLSLDRIDNSKGYSPENCRWATAKQQNQNRATVVFLELDGRRQCIADWAREFGIKGSSISGRLARGWTVRDAITRPPVRNGTWHVRPKIKTHCKRGHERIGRGSCLQCKRKQAEGE